MTRRTWAIPAWLVPVDKRVLSDRIGFIAGPTLRKLLAAVAAAERD